MIFNKNIRISDVISQHCAISFNIISTIYLNPPEKKKKKTFQATILSYKCIPGIEYMVLKGSKNLNTQTLRIIRNVC